MLCSMSSTSCTALWSDAASSIGRKLKRVARNMPLAAQPVAQRDHCDQDIQSRLLHLEQPPHTEGVSFADLPQPWLKALVHQLRPRHCQGLFGTCKGLAAAVAQHSAGLWLTPAALDETNTRMVFARMIVLQQDSNRRKFLLELAANCSNVHLYLEHLPLPLDVAAVWPCIKQLTLNNIRLTAGTVGALHLEQLAQLHTIASRTAWELKYSDGVDTSVLQQLVQHGGLASLRTVNCTGWGARTLLQQLSAILKDRVIELRTDNPKALQGISSWAVLEQLHLEPSWHLRPSHSWGAAAQMMFRHPQLKHAVVDSVIFYSASTSSNSNTTSNNTNINSSGNNDSSSSSNTGTGSSSSRDLQRLDILELCDYQGPELDDLLNIPLRVVKLLRFKVGTFVAINRDPAAAAQHLRQCAQVEVKPSTWRLNADGLYPHKFDCLPSDTPTWEVTFDPVLLEWMLPHINKAEGALILYGSLHWRCRGPVCKAAVDRMCLLPVGIHTLAIDNCTLDSGVTWQEVILHVPQHVRFLLIRRCDMELDDFRAILEQPPPAGLQRLSVAEGMTYMSWVWRHTKEVKEMVAAHWPGIELDLDLRPCEEDSSRSTRHSGYHVAPDTYGSDVD